MYISNACTCLVHVHVVFAYFGDVGAICSHFVVGRSDRSCSAFGFVGIIAQFVFVFVKFQQMTFHEVFALLNFTIRFN